MFESSLGALARRFAAVLLLIVATGAATAVTASASTSFAVTSPSDAQQIAATAPVFTGTADASTDPSVSLSVYSGTDTTAAPVWTGSASIDGSGDWQGGPSALAPGDYTLVTSHGADTPVTVHFTMLQPLTITSPTGGAATQNNDPSVAGTAPTGDPVTVAYTPATSTTGPTLTQQIRPSASAWSVDPASTSATVLQGSAGPLADGNWTITVTQGTSSQSVSLLVKHDAPALTLTSPADGSFTNSTAPTISGVAGTAAGDLQAVTLTITDSGHNQVGTPLAPTVNSDGSYSTTPPALPEGSYTVTATQADRAGNQASKSASFTVDTTAPALTLTSPADGSFTNHTKPTIAGATDGSGAVSVTIAGTSLASPLSLSATPSSGAWSVAPSSDLPEGSYAVTATQTDRAGNQASKSASFTVDTTAPALTLTSPADGSTTNNTKPTIAGATDGSGPVSVSIAGGSLGAPVSLSATPSGGSWSVAPSSALTDGTYMVTATQSDQAGNAASKSVTFTVDTTPPPAPALSTPVQGSDFTNQSTPALTGKASTAPGDGTVTVVFHDSTGNVIDTVTATPDSSGAYSVKPSRGLADGNYSALATQADAAGNVSPAAQRYFTVDTTRPALTVSSPTAGQTFTPGSTPLFAGQLGIKVGDANGIGGSLYSGSYQKPSDFAGVRPFERFSVFRQLGSSPDWSTVSGQPLPAGTYTLDVTQGDHAGNVTELLVHFTVTSPPATNTNGGGGTTPPSVTPSRTPVGTAAIGAAAIADSFTAQSHLIRQDGTGVLNAKPLPVTSKLAGTFVESAYQGTPSSLEPAAAKRNAKPKAILIASGRHIFVKPGRGTLVLRLTRAGKAALAHGKAIKVTFVLSFTPRGAHKPIVEAITLTLKRPAKRHH